MKITALKEQVKNKDRVSIFVDEKYSFSLTFEQLTEQKIKTGSEIDEADLKVFAKLSQDGKNQATALAWVFNRPRSIKEFHDYGKRKKFDIELVEQLTDRFLTRGYLDQERYAKWLVDLRLRKLKSQKAIQYELRSKGVSAEIINTVMPADTKNELSELIKRLKQKSRYQDEKKLKMYLIQKGFVYSDVVELLAEFNGSATS